MSSPSSPSALDERKALFFSSASRSLAEAPKHVTVVSRTNAPHLEALLIAVDHVWPGVAVTLVASKRVLGEMDGRPAEGDLALGRGPGAIVGAAAALPGLRRSTDLTVVALPHLAELGWTTWLWAHLVGRGGRIFYCDGALACRDWTHAQEELDLVAVRPRPLRGLKAFARSMRDRAFERFGPHRDVVPTEVRPSPAAIAWLAVGEPAFRLLGRRPGAALHAPAVRRVLIMEPDLLGDLTWATSLIEASGEFFSRAEIDVLAGPWSAPLLAGDARVTRVIEYDAPWFQSIARVSANGPVDVLRRLAVRWKLFRARYDVVLEPRGEVRHLRLAYLTGAPVRAGHALRDIEARRTPPRWASLLTHPARYPWDQRHDMHQAMRNLEPLRALGYRGDAAQPRLVVDPGARGRVLELLDETAGDSPAAVGSPRPGDSLVAVLVPGASREEKRWSADGFAEVGRRLASAGARVVVSGSSGERELAANVASSIGQGASSLAGRLSLADYVALISVADLVVTNETSAISFASAVGTPTVAIMTGVPELYGPLGVPGRVIQHRPECYDPYIEHCDCPWDSYLCLADIEVDEVAEAALALFAEASVGERHPDPPTRPVRRAATVAGSCLVCGAGRPRRILTSGGYPVVRCRACGFVQAGRIPTAEELTEFYDRGYEEQRDEMVDVHADGKRVQGRERLELIEALVPRGRLLDVGCSYGFFLDVAREAGWDAVGLEMSEPGVRYACDILGLEVRRGSIETAESGDESFDVVTLWDVLEHTADPVGALRRVRDLVAPGGVLAVVVPNAASPGARAGGRHWPWMIPPAHLYYFSPETITALLAREGFRVERLMTLRGDSENEFMLLLYGLACRVGVWQMATAIAAPFGDRSKTATERRVRSSQAMRTRLAALVDRPWTRRLVERWHAQGRGAEILCLARRVG